MNFNKVITKRKRTLLGREIIDGYVEMGEGNSLMPFFDMRESQVNAFVCAIKLAYVIGREETSK